MCELLYCARRHVYELQLRASRVGMKLLCRSGRVPSLAPGEACWISASIEVGNIGAHELSMNLAEGAGLGNAGVPPGGGMLVTVGAVWSVSGAAASALDPGSIYHGSKAR